MTLKLSRFALLAACAMTSLRAETKPDPVDQWIKQNVAQGSIAAASVAHIDGVDIDTRGYGHRTLPDGPRPDGDTRFQIGSITKVFTHLLLAEMDAAGVVRYGQKIGELLPKSFEPRNGKVRDITFESLATHASGLPRLPGNLATDDLVDPYGKYDEQALLAGLEIARDKQLLGNFYTYSNFGVGLEGHLLGKIDGGGYRKAVTTRVIAPLRLEHTAFDAGENAAHAVSGGKEVPAWKFQDALAGAGAIWGSAGDLARLVQVYLGTHEHQLRHDVKRDLEVAKQSDAGPFETTRVWHVARAGKHPIYWHNGGTVGFHSFVGFRPDTSRGVAILVSGDADPTDAGLQALGATQPKARKMDIDRAITGQYRFDDKFGIGILEQQGVLAAQATGQGPLGLHKVGEDWYANGEVDASIHVIRDKGAVTGIELVQGGLVQKLYRVADTATVASRKETKLDASKLADYVGVYSFAPNVVLTVKANADGLEAQLTGQPFFPVFARAADRFFYKVVDAELEFKRDGAGKIEAVVLHQGGIEQRAQRAP